MEFFNSLRTQPYRRTEDRIVGGVCAGIAHHFGIAPLVMRFVFVIAVLVSSWTLVAYAVSWMLLPEHRDGRIHVEELVQGRPNAALAGAVIVFILGTTNVGMLTFGTGGRAFTAPLAPIVVVALIVGAVVYLALRGRSHGAAPASMRPAGQPAVAQPGGKGSADTAGQEAAAGFAGMQATDTPKGDEDAGSAAGFAAIAPVPTGAGAADTADGGVTGAFAAPSDPAATRWQTEGGPRRKSPAVSGRFIAITIALALALAAFTLLVMGRTFGSLLTASGVGLGVLGVALAIAALRGLRGTWVTACSWLVTLPLVAATTVAVYTPNVVLTDPDAAFVSVNPNGQGERVTALIGGGRVEVQRDTPSQLHTAFAVWSFNIPDDANYRFVVSGFGSVSVMDYGGWKVLENGHEAVSQTQQWQEVCWEEPSDTWDEETGEFEMVEQCNDSIAPNDHTYVLNGRSSLVNGSNSLEVLTPAAVKDPAHAREVMIDLGVGSAQFQSSTQPDHPAPGAHRTPKPSATPTSEPSATPNKEEK